MKKQIKYLSLCGMLGYGYPLESLERALKEGIDFIGVDAGSTDPGPYYLGSGNAFVKDMQVRRDIEPALMAVAKHKIPLIIGSAGGSGARPHVDHFIEIVSDLIKKNGLNLKVAVIYADLEKHKIIDALENGKITPCGEVPPLTAEKIERLSNPVAQMGTEPIIEALRDGADVIIAGRCCDTAIFSAYPILHGFDPGLALHCAKIAECGALCARPVGANDSLLCTLAEDHFVVEPANPGKRCTPDSVAGHSLYEQPNPNCFFEPEGKIDMQDSCFDQISDHAVKVSGTVLRPAAEDTLKLEGAELKGYRAITLAGISDPMVIKNINKLEEGVRAAVASNLNGIIDQADYTLLFRRYGLDAATFVPWQMSVLPHEIGLLIEVIAPEQDLADNIISLARSTALHQAFEGRKATAGNLAFPFSPSDLRGGPVYEFSLYHLMRVENHAIKFPVKYIEIQ
jgi:hypothetical protein